MGGKLLESCCRRHDRVEYEEKVARFIDRLELSPSGPEYSSVVRCVRNKETFGDADIVYATVDDTPLPIDFLQVEFEPKEIYRNGEVTSLEFEELQIDLIHAENSYYDYAIGYHGNSDLGNFVGKLARYFGLSHGHKGLFLPLRDGSDMFASILVTLDIHKTLEFVGLDVNKFIRGFDSDEDVYNYVRTSPYYNPDFYKLENVSAIGRVRDRKRPSYRKFLEFNEKQVGTFLPKVEDKSIFLNRIFDFFPGTEEQFTTAIQHRAMLKLAASKFNGDIVRRLTGLVATDLGKFMHKLRDDPLFKPNIVAIRSQFAVEDSILKAFADYEKISN